jgi:nitroreductase
MSRIFAGAGVPPTVPDLTEALARAAAAAGQAPSIHNTQPWRWQVGDAGLDLYLDRARQLPSTDPSARMAILSCGAALHHARTALVAAGWQVEVAELPDPANPDHLAQLSLYDRHSATADAIRRVRAMRERRTDRRPVSALPVGADTLLAITVAAEEAGGWLHPVPRDRLVELGSATAYAQRAEYADEAWRAEIAQWAGGGRPDGTGVPDSAIPEHPTQTTVPSRDFGQPGTLPVGGHDLSATYAVLYGPADTPVDWLRAGQALSAAWLTATEHGVSLLPMSAAAELPATRQVLRRLQSGLGQPYLVVRLGIAAPGALAPHTPRLRPSQVIGGVSD